MFFKTAKSKRKGETVKKNLDLCASKALNSYS